MYIERTKSFQNIRSICFFFKQKNCDQTDLFCLCCFFTPQSTIFNHVEIIYCFTRLNQSIERIVSCSKTQHSDPGESQTILYPVYGSTSRTTVFPDQTVMVSRLKWVCWVVIAQWLWSVADAQRITLFSLPMQCPLNSGIRNKISRTRVYRTS